MYRNPPKQRGHLTNRWGIKENVVSISRTCKQKLSVNQVSTMKHHETSIKYQRNTIKTSSWNIIEARKEIFLQWSIIHDSRHNQFPSAQLHWRLPASTHPTKATWELVEYGRLPEQKSRFWTPRIQRRGPFGRWFWCDQLTLFQVFVLTRNTNLEHSQLEIVKNWSSAQNAGIYKI